jgi:hypothetical protein
MIYTYKVKQDLGCFNLEIAGGIIDEIVTDMPDYSL